MSNERAIAIINELVNVEGERNHEQEKLWEELYQECIKMLRIRVHKKGYSFSVEWNQEDYEQDVIFTIFRCLDKYDPTCATFGTWFSNISTKIYYKKYNKIKKDKGIQVIPMYVENEGNESVNLIDTCKQTKSVEKEYLHNMMWSNVYDEIGKLNDRQRDVVMLCDVEGMKPREVSKLRGYKSEDVSRWLNRAHNKLATYIVNESFEEELAYDYDL